MIKKVLIVVLAWGTVASANTITVEFQKCSNNSAALCALVYNDLTANRSYNQEEMLLSDDPSLSDVEAQEIGKKIQSSILANGRSFATNINGKIVSVNKFGGGKYNKLIMSGFSTSGPRPR